MHQGVDRQESVYPPGVVGMRRFTYDIWGDAVNTAARLEGASEVGRINVSEAVYRQMEPYFEFTERGVIDVKGKEPMRMYFLDRIRAEYARDDKGRVAGPKLLAILQPTGAP